MEDKLLQAAMASLGRLRSGRHYGASADSDCWVMVGRDLRDVVDWSILPPAASLTFAWGRGGCSLDFEGGGLRMRPGDWMWIDAGFVHRGENLPGSDFLTLFIPDRYVKAAALDLAPIGAAAQPAPHDLAAMLTRLSVLLLQGRSTQAVETPALDTILDRIGETFAPRTVLASEDDPVFRAASKLRDDHRSGLSIAEIAHTVGLSLPELSRRFKERYRITPKLYRKQSRLALATRELAAGRSVTAAAYEAGFSDTAHLSRTFREQYGIAPSTWSRRLNGAPAGANPPRRGGPIA